MGVNWAGPGVVVVRLVGTVCEDVTCGVVEVEVTGEDADCVEVMIGVTVAGTAGAAVGTGRRGAFVVGGCAIVVEGCGCENEEVMYSGCVRAREGCDVNSVFPLQQR